MNMLLKLVAILLLNLSFASGAVTSSTEAKGAVTYYPRIKTYNTTYFENGILKESLMDKLISVEGEVMDIRESQSGKVYLQVTLTELEQLVWVAMLPTYQEGLIKVGSVIKILGYADKTKNEPQFIAKELDVDKYILGMCLYEKSLELPLYFPSFMDKCIDWQEGKLTKYE